MFDQHNSMKSSIKDKNNNDVLSNLISSQQQMCNNKYQDFIGSKGKHKRFLFFSCKNSLFLVVQKVWKNCEHLTGKEAYGLSIYNTYFKYFLHKSLT